MALWIVYVRQFFKEIFWLLLMPTLLGTMMEEILNSLLTDPFFQVYHMRQKQYFFLMLMA